MYHSDSFELVGTPTELARALRFSEAEFHAALSDLMVTNIACHTARNGVVTLKSRRLERLHKKRSDAKLRQNNHRLKRDCHTVSASASASASCDQLGNRGPGKGDDSRPVELPHGFPPTVDDAIRLAGHCGADPIFITNLWNSAMARNGLDGTGQAIARWPNYVAKHWPSEVAKRAQAKANGKPTPVKQIDEVLRKVELNLKHMDRDTSY